MNYPDCVHPELNAPTLQTEGKLAMPEIGEIKKGTEIGYKGQNKFIWHACLDCGKERWEGLKYGEPKHLRCHLCSQKGELNGSWRGGRNRTTGGYIEVWVHPDDFFYPMTKRDNNYVLEHRLIMAKHLKRCLLSWEIVHHKNGIRNDNHLENLELLSNSSQHYALTRIGNYIKKLENRITLLEVENTILKKRTYPSD